MRFGDYIHSSVIFLQFIFLYGMFSNNIFSKSFIEDGFCISTIKVGGLYFPGDYFQFGKNSSKHAITLDQEQLSKKIFEIANSLDLKKIYMHSKETSNLIDGIITTLSGWDRKIDVTRPVVNEDTTLKGLIDIASSIASENQTVIFR